jgi:hypothetical protein
MNIQAESYQVERIGGGLRLSHHSGSSYEYFLLGRAPHPGSR